MLGAAAVSLSQVGNCAQSGYKITEGKKPIQSGKKSERSEAFLFLNGLKYRTFLFLCGRHIITLIDRIVRDLE